MYFDINGKFAGGWRYENGAITKTLTLTNAATTGGGPQINSEKPITTMGVGGCTVTPIVTVSWIFSGFDGTNHTASIRTNGVTCEPTYNVTGYILECSGGGGSSDGGGGGSYNPGTGTGGNTDFPSPIDQGCKSLAPASVGGKQVNLQPLVPTTPDDPCLVKPPDCAGVSGGSAYLATCGCIGGTTGVAKCPPAPKIIMDSLLKNFPCAVRLILDKLAQNGVYGDWVAPFATSQRPDLIWKNNNLAWNDSNHNYKLGETIGDPSAFSTTATITLNTKMLQNSSKLMIAAAAIHETLHAYINYNIKTAVIDQKNGYSDLGTWLYGIDSWASINGLPSNYSNHYAMMDDYFNKAVTILSTLDNNSHSTMEYQMAMLYGLDNAQDGTPAQKTTLQTEYNNLLARYNITASSLNTFYNNQVKNASASDKLPTTGCN